MKSKLFSVEGATRLATNAPAVLLSHCYTGTLAGNFQPNLKYPAKGALATRYSLSTHQLVPEYLEHFTE